MTGNEFKKARVAVLKITRVQLAALMATPLPTIRDIETIGADKPVRGCYQRLLELLIERDKWVMQTITERIAASVQQRFPDGIPSEIESDEI